MSHFKIHSNTNIHTLILSTFKNLRNDMSQIKSLAKHRKLYSNNALKTLQLSIFNKKNDTHDFSINNMLNI